MSSDTAVRFGPVQQAFHLNLGLDHRSSSANLLNLGPDFGGPVHQVRSGQISGSNREPPEKYAYIFKKNPMFLIENPTLTLAGHHPTLPYKQRHGLLLAQMHGYDHCDSRS